MSSSITACVPALFRFVAGVRDDRTSHTAGVRDARTSRTAGVRDAGSERGSRRPGQKRVRIQARSHFFIKGRKLHKQTLCRLAKLIDNRLAYQNDGQLGRRREAINGHVILLDVIYRRPANVFECPLHNHSVSPSCFVLQQE